MVGRGMEVRQFSEMKVGREREAGKWREVGRGR
jgi:hypothetical protein